MQTLLLRMIVVCAVALSIPSLRAETPTRVDEICKTINGVALEGYDPVTYFTLGKPAVGVKEITTTWRGATWRFVSAENRDLFVSNPDKYAPQYGGYCAWGVSQGMLMTGDPECWEMVSGKLYLTQSAELCNTFKKDAFAYIFRANANWPGILG